VQLKNLFFPEYWFSNYQKACTKVEEDINSSLDIITVIRRFRMHGVSLTLLQDSLHRKIAAGMATKRPIKMEKTERKSSAWNSFEGFN
jgi:hypothetical protein